MQRTYAVTHLSPRRKKRSGSLVRGRERREGRLGYLSAGRTLSRSTCAVGCVLNLGGREEDQLRTNHVSKEEVSNGYRVLGVLGCACVTEMCGIWHVMDRLSCLIQPVSKVCGG